MLGQHWSFRMHCGKILSHINSFYLMTFIILRGPTALPFKRLPRNLLYSHNRFSDSSNEGFCKIILSLRNGPLENLWRPRRSTIFV